MKPSFIIDTNIIIQFEDTQSSNEIKPLFAKLHQLFTKFSLAYFYHPHSEQDFESDQNSARKVESFSRLKKYLALPSPPVIEDTDQLEELYGTINRSNDVIDCQILYSLEKNCASFLVSEDKGIRKRARYRGIDDRVLNCKEAIDLIERLFEEKEISNPRVDHVLCYNLNLKDKIFDSLRSDYDGFDQWFLGKCCQQQRKCWVVSNNGQLSGICIHKAEGWKKIVKPAMKLCTFKISEDFEGKKYGELLLRVAFEYAFKNNIKTIWLTTYSKQEKLIYFLKEFGFRVHPELDGEQIVFFKELFVPESLPTMQALKFHIMYYPFYYEGPEIEKYVIPIKPEYYRILFPENQIGQLEFEQLNPSQSIPGNTIRKVYLSRSNKKEIPQGSLIIFYVTSPFSQVCTIGIVEKTARYNDEESLSTATGKRSVYSRSQIEQLSKKEVLVISFRFIHHFSPVDLNMLRDLSILKAQPQSISQISHDAYITLDPFIKF